MKLNALIDQVKAGLSDAGIENPGLDASVLVRHFTGLDRADLIAHPDQDIGARAVKEIEAAMQRRAEGEPVSRILGQKEFWGLNFKVTSDTLDPRPETEILVEAALRAVVGREEQPLRILDLGTGSGCILISLLSELSAAKGVAVDLNPGTLAVARENAVLHGVDERMEFVQGSWFDGLPPESRFDLIVSNPPYIANPVIESLAKEVRNHDPILALSGGDDGLEAYKTIFKKIKKHLAADGTGLFEIGFGQLPDLTRLVDDSNLRLRDSYPDLAGIPRVVEIVNGDK